MERKTEHKSTGPLVSDANEVAMIEARNALRQFDAAMQLVRDTLAGSKKFVLRPSLLFQLNRLATEGIEPNPGVARSCDVSITNSVHQPPKPDAVPALLEELCDYVNEHWQSSALHLASYVMWRINWVHPFTDGNGRTSRMVSYVVLCIRLGLELPGVSTIPEQIANDKVPYYDALEAADRAWETGTIDLSAMESLLSQLLANQLLFIHDRARDST